MELDRAVRKDAPRGGRFGKSAAKTPEELVSRDSD
jgi:hypothetical protein|eukprot:COSAG01_NODE_9770_length_2349_cov_1.145333_2_plen_35_part_00